MAKKIRHKALPTDEMTRLEEQNLQVAYDAAAEGIVLLKMTGYFL